MHESLLNRTYNFVHLGVCPNYIACATNLCEFPQLQLTKMPLKQDGMPFVLCPKQGSKAEVFVLNKVYGTRTLDISCTSVKRTYAAVFPDPVFALAKISFPSRAKGMAFSCKQ